MNPEDEEKATLEDLNRDLLFKRAVYAAARAGLLTEAEITAIAASWRAEGKRWT